ncbi:DUF5343 domain-containing protein [Hyphobacterium sp.]|uniref:DUF5343 domain-containing protein n=1 Tax=Hyphobacterium sp. TaxID=2004662 RepID=UPI003BAB2B99
MPVSQDKPAPYAPAKAIVDIIERHRSRGVPSPIDKDVLARAGVSDSLIPRTLQALHSLDLVDEDGSHTDVFEGLRLAPEAEFKQRMSEWLANAYADVLQYVDPANDDEVAIRDAFRPFTPTGQQSRMVSLFTGLYTAAGVRAAPSKGARSTRAQSSPRETERRASTTRRNPPPPSPPSPPRQSRMIQDGIPAPIAGLLTGLPREGEGWTRERRDAFMQTFQSVTDFCFPIVKPSEIGASTEAPNADAEDD